MIKLYCDRCKKCLSENTDIVDVSSYSNIKSNRFGEKELFLSDKYVLCNNCLHDFVKFMSEKENNNGE